MIHKCPDPSIIPQVTEEMFSTWMRIMTQVPGSVLWLSRLAVSNGTEARLRSAAASRGVSPDRLLPSETKEVLQGLKITL
jgi:predicted O-linked N-acetylglucosamine transferase (SPINDLY family)